MEKIQFSFKKGWGQLKQNDAPKAKYEIMKALNITTRASWGQRLNGEVEPKVSEAKAIETILNNYGVKQVWGE